MKRSMTGILISLTMASVAAAGVIYDARTGVYEPGEALPDIEAAVITWVCEDYGGMFITELPPGLHRGAQLVGFDPSLYAAGQLITISGATNGTPSHPSIVGGSILVIGVSEVPWIDITSIEAQPDLWGGLLGAPLHLTEAFTVTSDHGNGNWGATSILGGSEYYVLTACGDPGEFAVGDCVQGVHVIADSYDGLLMMETDGLEFIDCASPNDEASFGMIKSLYR